jgi:chaperonin cofactor prefoldin
LDTKLTTAFVLARQQAYKARKRHHEQDLQEKVESCEKEYAELFGKNEQLKKDLQRKRGELSDMLQQAGYTSSA